MTAAAKPVRVRIEYLDGRVEIVLKSKWDELSKDEDWLDEHVASADVVT